MWEILTFFALFLTLLAIIWYAYETRKLRMETLKQTELSLKPFIILSYDERKRKFILKNIGKGVGLNVKIADIPIIKEDGELYIRYIFNRTDVLIPEEKKEITGEIKINDGTSRDLPIFMSHFFPESAVKSYDFIVSYTNINNDPYKTKGKFGKHGIIIERTERDS